MFTSQGRWLPIKGSSTESSGVRDFGLPEKVVDTRLSASVHRQRGKRVCEQGWGRVTIPPADPTSLRGLRTHGTDNGVPRRERANVSAGARGAEAVAGGGGGTGSRRVTLPAPLAPHPRTRPRPAPMAARVPHNSPDSAPRAASQFAAPRHRSQSHLAAPSAHRPGHSPCTRGSTQGDRDSGGGRC
ncbi:hypothetical protein H8959_012338 [Pygathrix nigripes]